MSKINTINTESNAKFLADAFVNQLQSELSAEDFNEIKARNLIETDKRICHSHDFIDANAVMIEAYDECFDIKLDLCNQDHIDLINSAWSQARKDILN